MGKRRNKRNVDPMECIPFKVWTTLASSSTSYITPTIQNVDVTPLMDSRLTGISDYFQWFRFRQLKVTIYPGAAVSSFSTQAAVSVGYNPRVPNTAPTSHTEVCLLTKSAHQGMGKTIDTSLMLPKKIMLGDAPLKWFQTKAGTEATQFEVQGVLYFAITTPSTTTSGSTFSIEGICEFKSRSAATQTPLRYQPAMPEGTLQGHPISDTFEDKFLPIPTSSGQLPTGDTTVWKRLGSVREVPWSEYQEKECAVVGGIVFVKQSF